MNVTLKPLIIMGQSSEGGLMSTFSMAIKEEPFRLVGTLIFLLAIIHTLCIGFFNKKAHAQEEKYDDLRHNGMVPNSSKSLKAGIFHLLGEVEVVFGLWTIVLGIAMTLYYDFQIFTNLKRKAHDFSHWDVSVGFEDFR